MKKYFIPIGIALAFALYVIFYRKNGSTPPAANSNTTANSNSTEYKDGQFTGSVTDAYYGPYQVRAIISDGKIIDIKFLQTPHDSQTSKDINAAAMPYLKSETITAQSANIDIVTGATQSSQAFKHSLASALAQAK
jgi:uncharacterized protein with FMN-binding domain